MADKYCDHGLYGKASFTINAVSGSATMTVTAVASGIMMLGQVMGFDPTVCISAFGTGTGGTGTYTLNKAVTTGAQSTTATEGGIGTGTPTWGVALEGDGTDLGAATSATVSIDLSAATAAAGATISIMGATLTCVASGASTNQFNAGSGATLVSNLVAAINRATNTSVVAAQAAGWSTPKVQDAVFARIGSPTTTLQIMTRAGSAQYNSSVVTTSGFTGGTFGPYTFSGGAGGAWGYLLNGNTAIWPSAVARGGYGLLAAQLPLAGTVQPGDRVWLRNGRTVSMLVAAVNPFMAAMGTQQSPVRMLVDDGTIWSGDSATGKLTFLNQLPSASVCSIGVTNSSSASHIMLAGRKLSEGEYSLQFVNKTNAVMTLDIGGNSIIEGFILDGTGGFPVSLRSVGAAVSGHRAVFADGVVKTDRNSNVYWQQVTTNIYAVDIDGVVFDNNGSTVANTGLFSIIGNVTTRFLSCRFNGFVIGSELIVSPIVALGQQWVLAFDNCDWGNVTKRGPYVGLLALAANYTDMSQKAITSVNRDAMREFHMDTMRGFVAWNASRGQPTCTAVLDDGVTGYSLMVVPPTQANNLSWSGPLRLPRLGKINSLADGARTVSVEFIAEESLTPTSATVSMQLEYQAVDGTRVLVDSFDLAATAIPSSTASWTNEVGGFVTFQNGGTVNHNKFKLSLSTVAGKPMKSGTEVSVWVRVHTSVPDATKTYFFDEPQIV